MAATTLWTRDQLLIAFTLYSQLPFGKLHSRNPDIIHYAELMGRTPSALAMKLVNLASLDPIILNSGRTGLSQVSKADRALWQEMEQDPQRFEQQCQQAMGRLTPTTAPSQALEPAPDVYGRERLTPIRTRVGQQLFRKRVLGVYGERCCLTGLETPTLLIASHIRPWKDAAEYRLDPRNGLCLSALHDKAFDTGLITFNDHLELVLSRQIKKLVSPASATLFAQYEGQQMRLPDVERYAPDLAHLAYHRQHIFQR
ncbi:HNH endonuclease [Musicola keenii]|uniref:HNH endonuclease n=1 Tax=Musicola keenii TaxID=2884250 RepID=UPI00177AD759|nr:HNH endonuclease [Musicola keenii]